MCQIWVYDTIKLLEYAITYLFHLFEECLEEKARTRTITLVICHQHSDEYKKYVPAVCIYVYSIIVYRLYSSGVMQYTGYSYQSISTNEFPTMLVVHTLAYKQVC